MCIVCSIASRLGQSSGISPLNHGANAGSLLSHAGLVVGYTPPSPLPNFTDAQIVQALRTSGLGAKDENGDFAQDLSTRNWIGPTITYRLITSQTTITNTNGTATTADDSTTIRDNMSAHEQLRIDEAFEIWDDFVSVNIEKNQLAGDAGQPQSFMNVFYVSGGTTNGSNDGDTSDVAFAGPTDTTNVGTNIYGTTAWRIDNGQVSLGRNFNNGEFDGRVGNGGAADNGVNDLSYGERGFETVMHEIGHALGLTHPGFYDSGADVTPANGQRFAQDTLRNTIMSYNSEISATTNYYGVNASTPMVYDILAIQAIYGADFNVRSGNTSYGTVNNSGRDAYSFSDSKGSVFAIWDGAGIDTINASGCNTNSVINLAPGSYSSIGRNAGLLGQPMLENIGIAFNVWIENAIGGSGQDRITGNDAANELHGNFGNDTLAGEFGNDRLYGGTQVDTLRGGLGEDWLDGGAGADTLDGGASFDTASWLNSLSGVNVFIDGSLVTGGDAQGDTLISIENLDGSNFDDQFAGDAQSNTLSGNGGNDSLYGADDLDFLDGGAGDDRIGGGAHGDSIAGGSGFDTAVYVNAVTLNFQTNSHSGEAAGDSYTSIERYEGGDQADTMTAGNTAGYWLAGGGGNDQLFGGTQNDIFETGTGADIVDGGGGINEVTYFYSNARVVIDLFFGASSGGHAQGDLLYNIQNVSGSLFNDILRGDSGLNVLYGFAGDDNLRSLGGGDLMVGGAGNDEYTVDVSTDRVRENAGEGTDTVRAVSSYTLDAASGEVEWLVTADAGSTAAINLTGNDYANQLAGNAGNNQLRGGGGSDMLYTDAGSDVLDGGSGFDTIVFHKGMLSDWAAQVYDADISGDQWLDWEVLQGSAAADTIRTGTFWANGRFFFGMGGNDEITISASNASGNTLSGGDGDDRLTGGSGFDNIEGNDGADILTGGAGIDILSGGLGNDTYFDDFDDVIGAEAAGGGYDTINTPRNSYTLLAGFERVNYTGTGSFVGTGNALANRFQSLGGDDRFVDVLGGADIFSGGGGTDTVDFRTSATGVVLNFITNVHTGASAGDSYSSIEKFLGSTTAMDKMSAGGTGRVVYVGYGGDDRLNGGVKNDQLLGGDGNDILKGNADRDSLDGGRGNDTMTGGSEGDVFVFIDAAFGQDTITDYQDGLDSFKVFSAVADNINDFIVTGNGTASVTLTLAGAPANVITINGVAPIIIAADDFVFY